MAQDRSYTARATATGGETPRVRAAGGLLDLTITTPRALGGPGGEATDAEQLLAAGYAACFLSAMRYAAATQRETLPADVAVSASVNLTQGGDGRFAAQIIVEAQLKSLPDEQAKALVRAAEAAWPYPDIEVRASADLSAQSAVGSAGAHAYEGRGYGG